MLLRNYAVFLEISWNGTYSNHSLATMRQAEVSANNLNGWDYFQQSYLSFVFLPIAELQINCKL